MGHKYKLVYFDAPGRAELIRWIFAYGGQEFEDHRIKREDWPSLKATTPFGKLPYLEVDGKALPESVAIARFAARKTGLVGSDDFEAAQADALVDHVADASKGLAPLRQEQDEKKKVAMKEEYVKTTLPPFLTNLEKQLKANNNGEGFFIGSKPTWADFAVVLFLNNPAFDTTVLDGHPLLKALQKRVLDLKPIKEWQAKHPSKV